MDELAGKVGRPEKPVADSAKPMSEDASLGGTATIGHGFGSLGDHLVDQGFLTDGSDLIELGSRYTIKGLLGEGGMGCVQLAFDNRLRRNVAIKRIVSSFAQNNTAVTRFLDEARSIALIGSHPNVVQVYDFGRSEEGPFIVMEYVGGGSLADLCKAGPVAAEKVVPLFIQVCDGLARAHDRGIVHRDIKPSNILLDGSGVPKLADFGLVKTSLFEHLGSTGHPVGTPEFMSPEQWSDSGLVDSRSDLWSLGASLYRLISGSSAKVIRLDQIPNGLKEVIAQAVEENRNDRFQTAEQFGEALRRALGQSTENLCVSGRPNGGRDLDGQCTSCGATSKDIARKFCGKCGANLWTTCLRCQADVPVWERFCGKCGGGQEELARRKECLEEARKHIEAFDWQGAVRSLESIPKAVVDDEVLLLLKKCEHSLEEFSGLLARIGSCISEKKLDGLLPIVQRALQLRGDRADIARLENALTARRDKRIELARLAMSQDDVGRAWMAVSGGHECDFGQNWGFVKGVSRARKLEELIACKVGDIKTRGGPSSADAHEVLRMITEYRLLNPSGRKLSKLASECVRILGFTNSLGMKFKYIPAGCFLMSGRAEENGEGGCAIEIKKPFFLSKGTVTNRQWRVVMGSVLSTKPNDDCPVTFVNVNDAEKFCEKLSRLPGESAAGREYRLPTECEWEYACRAGTDTSFSFGNDAAFFGDFGWCQENSSGREQPVGKKHANAWGLKDMHGNVWELCVDYAGGHISQPDRGAKIYNAGYSVCGCGGSCNLPAAACHSGSRAFIQPWDRLADLGFRVAVSAPA